MTTEGGTIQPAGEERWPAGEENWPPGEQKWWRLLRRAFRVPDIVSARNREAAVAHALLEGFPAPTDEASAFEKGLSSYDPLAPHKRQLADARNVVAKIAEIGATGDLDELFFVALGPGRPDNDALRKLVAGRANSETGRLVEKAFTVVTNYVNAHRFEDSPDLAGP